LQSRVQGDGENENETLPNAALTEYRGCSTIGTVSLVEVRMETKTNKTVLSSFKEYMKSQLDEIFSDFNKWVTGERVKHPPTNEEIIKNYLENGGPEHFAETHGVAKKEKGSKAE
jgi:hypothetical protein